MTQNQSIDKEILECFYQESSVLMVKLENIVQILEKKSSTFPTQALTDFANTVDGIMGASKVLLLQSPNNQNLKRISTIAEFCKKLGNKAKSLNHSEFIPIFAAFWADTVEFMNNQLQELMGKPTQGALSATAQSQMLERRLKWLYEKVTPLANDKVDQSALHDLLKKIQG